MPRHVFTDDMAEVTGYGGVCEEQARQAVIAGVMWLEDNPTAQPEVKADPMVFGAYNNNADAKLLEATMGAEMEGESAAAMQTCLGHVLWAYKHGGWDAYVAESKRRK